MAETPERGISVPVKHAVRPKKPSVGYSPKLVDAICARLAIGETWLAISKDDGMPSYQALYQWRKKRPGVEGKVEMARQMGADALADELLDTARAVTTATVSTTKVHVDGLKWSTGRGSLLRHGARAGTAAAKGAVRMHIRVRRFEKLYDDEGRAFLREILLEGEQ